MDPNFTEQNSNQEKIETIGIDLITQNKLTNALKKNRKTKVQQYSIRKCSIMQTSEELNRKMNELNC